ncbi:hypothetical protein BBJ28_00022227, partial [Nothophytophthora sp. Chile5]
MGSFVPTEPFPASSFAEARHQLLAGMVSRKVTGKGSREGTTVACSTVKWSQIAGVYGRRLREGNGAIPIEIISEDAVTPFMAELRSQQKWYGGMSTKDLTMKRSSAINTCDAADIVSDTSTQFAQGALLRNSLLLCAGKVGLLASNENRKIVVVQTSNEDPKQGFAQNLLKMELALAENERGAFKRPLFSVEPLGLPWKLR